MTNSTGWVYKLEVGGRQVDLAVDGEAVIGRSRSCTVTLNDLSVSRNHAVIAARPGRVTVKDLESSNGTYLNGVRLATEAELADGDRVTIGETDIIMRIAAPQSPGSVSRTEILPQDVRGAIQAAPPPPAGAGPSSRVPPPSAGGPDVGVHATAPVRDPLAPSLPSLPPLPPLPPMGAVPPPRPAPPPPARPAAAPAAAGSLLPDIDLGPPPARPAAPAVPAAGLGGRIPTAVLPVGAPAPAGFWIRVGAQLLDAVWMFPIIFGLNFILTLAVGRFGALLAMPVNMAIAFGVPFVGWTRYGKTPGKHLLGLVVCDAATGRVGLEPKQALLRIVGQIVCGFTLGIGYLLVAFSPNRRGLHDLIAGTYVGSRR
jgi:uncharacterized RDD family membrane protein YckC